MIKCKECMDGGRVPCMECDGYGTIDCPECSIESSQEKTCAQCGHKRTSHGSQSKKKMYVAHCYIKGCSCKKFKEKIK